MLQHRSRTKRYGLSRPLPILITLFLGLTAFAPAAAAIDREESTFSPSDRAIEMAIEADFLVDSEIDSNWIDVSVNDGIVTLIGAADHLLSKERAAALAESTRGVRAVINRLELRKPLATDAEIENDVERALLYDSVTHFERQTAERVVGNLAGIVEVSNRIEVDRDPQVLSDWELREEIESQLWWSPFVDSDDVGVTVVDGVATLDGTVDTRAERRAAMSNAYQAGAFLVRNELEISGGEETDAATGYHPFLFYYYPLPI